MRILLTGAAGNLGTALRRLPGVEFIPLGRDDWTLLPELLDPGVDAVLHAAWDLRTPITSDPVAVFDSNVMATMRLLEACRDRRVPRFGYVSTCAVYGESMETAEDGPCQPVTVNGISKLLNERVVEAFCAEAGIEAQIYRVFNMFGGNDRFSVLSHLRRALQSDRPFILNNDGVAQRDFIHVDDVAAITLQLLGRSLPVTHVNVGTGRSTRISDIVDLARRLRPDLMVTKAGAREAEYSRADTEILRSLVGDFTFVEVLPFLKEELSAPVAGDGPGSV